MSKVPQCDYVELYKEFENFKRANPHQGTVREFCKRTMKTYATVQKGFTRLKKRIKTGTPGKKDEKRLKKRLEIKDTRKKGLKDIDQVIPINIEGENIYERRIQPRLLEIERMYFNGSTDKEVYKFLRISHGSFYKYVKEYPELKEAINIGKSYSDYEVEKAVYDMATGKATVEETKSSISGDGQPRVDKTVKQVPANIAASKFWLLNRNRERWKNENQIEPEQIIDPLAGVTEEELDKELAKLDE